MKPFFQSDPYASNRLIPRRFWGFLSSVLFLLVLGTLWPARGALARGMEDVSDRTIQVRFKEDTVVNPPGAPLPIDLLSSVQEITRLFTLPEERLNELRAAGQAASGSTLPDLNLWFEITLIEGTDAASFLADLKLVPSVDVAQLAPLPAPLPAVTPNFTGFQGYLGTAPNGINAVFSATLPGGNGSGITIYDVEYDWNQDHEDLSKAYGIRLLLNPGDSAEVPDELKPFRFRIKSHGTAVLGILIADNDAKGVTGISSGAKVGLAPANTDKGYYPENAILLAVAAASPGDVILIEQQLGVCKFGPCTDTGGGCGPLEWDRAVFDAIQTATANRIVVVEAAGNGGVNLDDREACGDTFDRTIWDSGAIIVGAGRPPGMYDRQRLGFSSYGSRVDLQGWGDGVMTTGYGDYYYNPDAFLDSNFYYREDFNGTSSASAIVAGAVANLQGIAINLFGTPLVPFQVRRLLAETGSPQLPDASENIGPRPDLQAAIARLREGAIDLFMIVDLSGSFRDDLPRFQAQAPGIIDTINATNGNVRWGLARFEDYPIPPFGSAAAGDMAYERLIDLTHEAERVKDAIKVLTVRYGDDSPQSQLAALFQAASGAGQDLLADGFPEASIPQGQQANFRVNATKIFLLWTDARFHLPGDPGIPGILPYPGPSFVDTVDAIMALDPPVVIGISSGTDAVADLKAIAAATNSLAPSGGVDCNGDGSLDLPEGDPLVCSIALSGEGIGKAIETLVDAAIEAATPVAKCMDVTVPAERGVCTASAGIDRGSFDPDGGPIALTQSPPGPYSVGERLVTLKATDETGLTGYCTAIVTVLDQDPPTLDCPSSLHLFGADCLGFAQVPHDSAQTQDNCGEVTLSASPPDVPCDQTQMVTITATDGSGNVTTCSLPVSGECRAPLAQGYWHRQCLGAGLIKPGHKGRGPQKPLEPDFVKTLVPAVDQMLQDTVSESRTCQDGIDAQPPSDPCERALKAYTSLLLNLAASRVDGACGVDLVPLGCGSATISDLVRELAALINSGDPDSCRQAAQCAGATFRGRAGLRRRASSLSPVTGLVDAAAPADSGPARSRSRRAAWWPTIGGRSSRRGTGDKVSAF